MIRPPAWASNRSASVRETLTFSMMIAARTLFPLSASSSAARSLDAPVVCRIIRRARSLSL